MPILLAETVSYLHSEAALIDGFTVPDDNGALNVPSFCLVGAFLLEVEFVIQFLGTV